MPDDLNRIAKELETVTRAAEQASARINELQNQLRNLLTQTAKGGVPIAGRIGTVAEQLTGGVFPVNRVRVGGGARITLSAIQPEVTSLVDEILTTQLRLTALEAKKIALTPSAAFETEYRRLVQEAQENLLRTVRRSLPQAIHPPAPVSMAAEDQARREAIAIMLRNAAAAGGTNIPVTNPYAALEKSFGTGVTARIKEQISQLETSLGRVFDPSQLKIQASAVRSLAEGFGRLNVTLSEGGQPLKSFRLYIDQLTGSLKVLTEAEYAQLRAAEVAFTPQALTRALGGMRAGRALNLASTKGFGIENLKNVFTQEPSGVSVLRFEKDIEGVAQKLEVTMDRMGGIIMRTNKRLLGFFDAVVRNTAEVLRWSIGVGLVYGSIFKLQELIRVAIENEVKLADITVTLGDAHRDLNEIFLDAAKVANLTGESINAVLDTYVYAYRAVGAVEDPIQRTTAANKLLYNSTILNKLSTLDQAESIDVLSGALRQLQKPGQDVISAFDEAGNLLDKWVAVTRKANVDLATLATAFSITSESAENSGVSIEQLNAIIASLSEKIGGLGGRETGNAVRALIGGVYQQQAAEILSRYGIAISDTTGKMRPFLNISKDIYDLYSQGIIDTDQLNKIAYVLGGGVRRGQQYVAFLSDLARIQEIVAAQANVAGSAEEALGRKIDTTQTAITRLGNAFQTLAQTLGGTGGVLDTFKGILNLATLLVNVFNTLDKVLGRIAIPATILALGRMYFRGEVGAARYQGMRAGLGGAVGGAAESLFGMFPAYQLATGGMYTQTGFQRTTRAQEIGQTVGGFASKYGLGILAGAYPAISRAGEGQNLGAAVDIGGAILGTLIAGGNPLGGIIGSAVADSFIAATLAYKPEFTNFFKTIWGETTETEPGKPSKAEELRQAATREAFRGAGFGSEFLGKLSSRAAAGVSNAIMSGYALLSRAVGKPMEWQGVTPEQAALINASPEAFRKVQEASRYTAAVIPEETSRIALRQGDIKKVFSDYIDQLAKIQREALRKQSVKREVSPKELQTGLETVYGLPASVSKLYTVLNQEGDKFLQLTKENKEAFKDFSDLLFEASSEDREAINALTTEISDIDRAIESLKDKAPEALAALGKEMLTSAQLTELENSKLTDLIQLLEAVADQIQRTKVSEIKIPGVIGLEGFDLSEMQRIIDKATQLQEQKLKAALKEGFIPDEETKNAMIEQAEPIFIYLGELLGYYLTKGIVESGFITEATDLLVKAGEITKAAEGIDFQVFDLTTAQFQQLMAMYPALLAQLTAKGYTENATQLIPILSDAILGPQSKDWKIVQLLLQQIADNTKEQVEGMFNLPSGATFYVPFRAAELDARSRVGGLGGLSFSDLLGASRQGTEEGARLGVIAGFTQLHYPELRAQAPELTSAAQIAAAIDNLIIQFREVGISLATNKWLKGPGNEYWDQFFKESGVTPPYGGYYTPYKDVMQTRISAEPKEFDLLGVLKSSVADPIISAIIGLGASFEEILNFLLYGKEGTSLTPKLDSYQQISAVTAEAAKPLQTKLSLEVNSNVQLIVDGQTLANVIKPYLYLDLLRYDQTAGTVTKVVTI